MKIKAENFDDYIKNCPEERQVPLRKLRSVIAENIPAGFEEAMSYGMPGWVVPHSIYPAGYHVNPKEPLPFISVASQKNFIGLYHMGIYASPELMEWFVIEYPKHCDTKLDMGKSCVRLKKPEKIPFELLGELASKMTVGEWVKIYESHLRH